MDAGLFPIMIKLAQEGSMDVRKECVWALSNAGMGDGHAVAEVKVILDALGAFLSSGMKRAHEQGGENIFCGKLEDLQEDANESVYNTAVKLLTDYFNVEDDAETPKETAPDDFNAAPANFNFNFGAMGA